MKNLSIVCFFLAPISTFAAQNTYKFVVESDIEGKPHATATFTVKEGSQPGSQFLTTPDGVYMFQWAATDGELNGEKGIKVSLISGKLPDPNKGSFLKTKDLYLKQNGSTLITHPDENNPSKNLYLLEVHVSKI